MPALNLKQQKLAIAIACGLLATGAHAQTSALSPPPLPVLVPDSARPVPWPQAVDGSTWVPVFMLGDGDGSVVAGPFSVEPAGSVLLGIAQVRSHSGADESIAISPSVRWRVSDDLRVGAAVTVTEFVPCRSLMQQPLAPLRADACESFAAQGNPSALGVSGSVSFGDTSLSLGYSESPAIWVLPGSIGPAASLATPGAALPMAPLASLANESTRTLTLGGELSLSDQSRLGVALAMSRLPRLENSPDIGRVQFSLAYGDFSADMATQMIRHGIETVSPWWASMDLGVSWRTPWSGVLSVGARNLFTRGDPPQLGNSPAATINEVDAFSRTPYVRYEQDF